MTPAEEVRAMSDADLEHGIVHHLVMAMFAENDDVMEFAFIMLELIESERVIRREKRNRVVH